MQHTVVSPPVSALIVEGGAMRCIYSAGILDSFIAADFYPFTFYLGVSAGASNVAAYLGKKQGRNYQVYTQYCQDKRFKNWRRFLLGGHLIDIDWLWDITERELPIGLDSIASYGERFLVVATCAKTGEAHYITPSKNELFAALKCSGNMPFAFKGKVMLRGKMWFDGGVADSLPVQKAYDMGARRMLVLRSNPADYQKKPYKINKLFPKLMQAYPAIAKKLQTRHQRYNAALDFIRNPPADCEVLEICPPNNLNVGQFTTDITLLNNAYQQGMVVGEKILQENQLW